eukprot:m51a1_g7495 putative biotin synthase (332) ;mRNA; r:257264-258321
MEAQAIRELAEAIIKQGHEVTQEEALGLARTPHRAVLHEAADAVRRALCGDQFDLCSVINARSGLCPEDCAWCSQSVHHSTGVKQFDAVDIEDALSLACHNSSKGVHRFSLVTSGREVSDADLEHFIGIYEELGRKTPGLGLCASMGLLDRPRLERLRRAGVEHYHCNIETAPSHFAEVCTTHTVEDKARTIRWAQEAGLRVCSGVILGVGESVEQRVEAALFLRSLGVVSIPVNVLIPIAGTRLERQAPLAVEDVEVALSVFRMVNPRAWVRMAAGRARYIGRQHEVLHCGANASIVGDMLTTVGGQTIEQDVANFTASGFSVRRSGITH